MPKPFVDYTADEFQRVVSANLAGFSMCRRRPLKQLYIRIARRSIAVSETLAGAGSGQKHSPEEANFSPHSSTYPDC